VHAGLVKARKQGRVGGRPRVVVDHVKIMRLYGEGETLREIGEEFGIAPATVMRILKSHRPKPTEGIT
jgi:DNA invertase Pin-like site-specific DNA recombinase